jgi:predicted O-methyltransferase YrrM
MSSEPTLLSAAHFSYVAERTAGDDDFLRDLKAAAVEAGLPAIWISAAQASLINVLLRLAKAAHVIDVGTLAGYSAISMARALPEGGHLVTIELNPKHADFAEEWIARSDVADRITVARGPASEVLPQLADESFDAMFLDADKGGYESYREQGLRLLRKGALFMADNAFAFGELFAEQPKDREVVAIREFNDHMARSPGMTGVIVPAGDGMWVAVKD